MSVACSSPVRQASFQRSRDPNTVQRYGAKGTAEAKGNHISAPSPKPLLYTVHQESISLIKILL
jgi:hypothetical protein